MNDAIVATSLLLATASAIIAATFVATLLILSLAHTRGEAIHADRAGHFARWVDIEITIIGERP